MKKELLNQVLQVNHLNELIKVKRIDILFSIEKEELDYKDYNNSNTQKIIKVFENLGLVKNKKMTEKGKKLANEIRKILILMNNPKEE